MRGICLIRFTTNDTLPLFDPMQPDQAAADHGRPSFHRSSTCGTTGVFESSFAAHRSELKSVGTSLIQQAQLVAESVKDDAAYRRWSERSAAMTSGEDSYLLGLALLQRPQFRHDGQAILRRVLASSPQALARTRRLQEDRKAYLHRVDDARHVVLAALGRSLVADGHTREGLDTLGLAANGSWDPDLFTSLSAGAIVRPLRGSPSVDDTAGQKHTLRSLTKGTPTAVIFWSRHCGYAIEALPTIARVAERMTREGNRVLFVVDEPPSADIKRYLATRHWSLPVYYDTRREMISAFASFGTPAYYVLDESGRIRFDEVNVKAELIAQVEALRAEHGKN